MMARLRSFTDSKVLLDEKLQIEVPFYEYISIGTIESNYIVIVALKLGSDES
jgi:hypothetical protein